MIQIKFCARKFILFFYFMDPQHCLQLTGPDAYPGGPKIYGSRCGPGFSTVFVWQNVSPWSVRHTL
jgi:hypothetical protein